MTMTMSYQADIITAITMLKERNGSCIIEDSAGDYYHDIGQKVDKCHVLDQRWWRMVFASRIRAYTSSAPPRKRLHCLVAIYKEMMYDIQNEGVRVQHQNVLETWAAVENDTKTYPKVVTFLMSSGDKYYAIGTHYVTLDLCTPSDAKPDVEINHGILYNQLNVECDIVNKCKRTNPFEQSFLIKNLAVLSLFLPYQQRLTQKQNTR